MKKGDVLVTPPGYLIVTKSQGWVELIRWSLFKKGDELAVISTIKELVQTFLYLAQTDYQNVWDLCEIVRASTP